MRIFILTILGKIVDFLLIPSCICVLLILLIFSSMLIENLNKTQNVRDN
jgi:hypothetical protein